MAARIPSRLLPKELRQALGVKHKYRNEPVVLDGHRFASKWEAKRWGELKFLLDQGRIANLRPHRVFPLVVRKLHVGDYVSDFSYNELPSGDLVVEDTKGFLTDVYKLKRRLMRALYGIIIREVRRCPARGRRASRR